MPLQGLPVRKGMNLEENEQKYTEEEVNAT